MAMHSYVTIPQVRDYSGFTETIETPDDVIQLNIDTATTLIDEYCGRSFDAKMELSRTFPAEFDIISSIRPSMEIGDVLPSGDLDITVEVSNRPYEATSWEERASGWWLGPLNKPEEWPYTTLEVDRDRSWRGRFVRITTDWGWREVPSPIQRASLMLATRWLHRKDTPLGQEGSGEFGVVYVRKVDPDVQNMVRPFKRVTLLGS